MVNFKRLGRITVCLLLCCAACIFLVESVSAVSSSSVTPVSNTVIPNAPIIVSESETAVSAGHDVSSIHRYASYGSRIIGCLENGTKLTVLGTKGDFYRIDCYDMEGYIAKSQVTATDAGEYYVNCADDSSESRTLESFSVQESLELKSAVLAWGSKYIGVKYVWGGMSPYGFDCSGLVKYVFNKAGMTVGRTTVNLLEEGVGIAKEDLQCGDLVFFSNTGDNGGFCSHVGIYVGNGQLLHSGTKGVTIVNLDSPYFVQHYLCSRRMILSDLNPTAAIPTVGAMSGSNSSYWRNAQQDGSLGMG